MRPRFTDTARAGPLAGRHQQRNNRDACVGRVCPTLRITCEAHIDDDRAVVEHLQLQRFDWFMRLLGTLPFRLRSFLSPRPLDASYQAFARKILRNHAELLVNRLHCGPE
jgi:hypothetical protein